MTTPILHHYEFSTFSEKVRIAMGLKKLAWHSVDIPGMPPRPLLTPLTGGYRRAPVLQIGADIYCDTHAILGALERLQPQPSLIMQDIRSRYMSATTSREASYGMAYLISSWRKLLWTVVSH